MGNFCVVQNPVTQVLTEVKPIPIPCSMYPLYLSEMLEVFVVHQPRLTFVFIELECFYRKDRTDKQKEDSYRLQNLKVSESVPEV